MTTVCLEFQGVAKRKLDDLQNAGWQINGVCFSMPGEDGVTRHGAITEGGKVLWWNQPHPPVRINPPAMADNTSVTNEQLQVAAGAPPDDPCPGCRPNHRCRTPKCGRLALDNGQKQAAFPFYGKAESFWEKK